MKQVIIMRGCAGSGKSTWVSKTYPDAKVVSADNFFVKLGNGSYRFDPMKLTEAHVDCFKEFLLHLTNKASLVCVDNTNTSAWEMSPYIALAQAMGYDYDIVWVKCDSAIAFARNTHGVPLKGIQSMTERMNQKLPPYWKKQIIVEEGKFGIGYPIAHRE